MHITIPSTGVRSNCRRGERRQGKDQHVGPLGPCHTECPGESRSPKTLRQERGQRTNAVLGLQEGRGCSTAQSQGKRRKERNYGGCSSTSSLHTRGRSIRMGQNQQQTIPSLNPEPPPSHQLPHQASHSPKPVHRTGTRWAL